MTIKAGKVLVLGILLATFSCTDLEETLYSDVTPEDFFESEEQVAAAVGAIYAGWTGNYIGEIWSLSEISSDEVVVPTRQQDWFDNGNWQRIHLHTFESRDDRVTGSWNTLFDGLSTANRVLAQFSTGDPNDDNVKRAIVQARGMRALIYFWLLDQYGNVPIVTETSDDPAPPNNTRAEVYNFVETELSAIVTETLTDGSTALNKTVDATTYGTFTYWAAKALQAKLYLNSGVYTGSGAQGAGYISGNTAAAKAAVEDILINGPFSYDSYFNNFLPNNSGSTENIFVLIFDEVFAGGFNMVVRTLHYESQKTYNLSAQPWNGYCTLQEFYESFEGNDERIGAITNYGDLGDDYKDDVNVRGASSMFIVGPQFESNGNPTSDPGWKQDSASGFDIGPQVDFTPGVGVLEPNTARQAGARIGKYPFEDGGKPDSNQDYPVFRYGDFVLMAAEIAQVTGSMVAGKSALEHVNDVRAVRGLGPISDVTSDGTIWGDPILTERGHETAFEYWRRNDLIRYGRFLDEWWGKTKGGGSYTFVIGADAGTTVNPTGQSGRFDNDVVLFPIPFSAVESNPNLVQNPGHN